jgi:hypothetical protein
MGIRKGAKFLNAAEREAFVKACVLLKADIVNPGAPVADQYSRWDELTALHRMIQNAFSPLGTSINPGFACDPGPDGDGGEPFTRILTASLGAVAPPR